MIAPSWVQMMAAYNAEMNHRLYDAAARLDDAARRQHRGAFWGSIHGTLAHLVWGDRQWMSRFDHWEKNTTPMAGSNQDARDFPALHAERRDIDVRIAQWAQGVTPAWLASDLTWYSGAAKAQRTKPLGMLVTHFFNHQTHHRGQVHAMITAAGETTADTDLMMIV